ncbi:hypothetical protein AGMMS49938_07580 [Fibrobacterales bacterium]|nr:hypothetical protein AGMMS49938_07580 [Fibrobacterales bacterium]
MASYIKELKKHSIENSKIREKLEMQKKVNADDLRIAADLLKIPFADKGSIEQSEHLLKTLEAERTIINDNIYESKKNIKEMFARFAALFTVPIAAIAGTFALVLKNEKIEIPLNSQQQITARIDTNSSDEEIIKQEIELTKILQQRTAYIDASSSVKEIRSNWIDNFNDGMAEVSELIKRKRETETLVESLNVSTKSKEQI